jgi:hypothetical protein
MKRNLLLFFSIFVAFLASAQVPTITSFSPMSATFGYAVTLTGTNFSNTLSDNLVSFGNIRATVLSASGTSLTVQVPEGATFDYISVSVSGKTAYSLRQFTPTFACGTATLDTTSFIRPSSRYFAKTGATCQGSIVGDIDGDGKQDLILAQYADSNLVLFRNVGQPGSLDSNSFVKTLYKLPFRSVFQLGMGDLNGDGKPEIIAGCFSADTFIVLQNNSTPGNISLATGATGGFVSGSSACAIKVADMDADGISDLIIVNRNRRLSIFKNSNTGGTLTSANFTRNDILVGASATMNDVAIGDINQDGAPDIVVPEYGAAKMHIYTNNGSMSFTDNLFTTSFNGIWGITLADFDGNGKLDIGGSYRNNNVTFVYPNTTTTSTPTLGTPFTYTTTGVQFIYCIASDLNGDAKPDLVFANLSTTGNTYIYQNTSTVGSISFATPFHLKQATGAINISVSDIDQDGFPDIFFPDNANGGYSFRNANGTRVKVYDIDTVANISAVNLRYTSLGVPAIEYSVNYNAETGGDGFVGIPWTAITSSPLVIPVPQIAGTYYGNIQVRNATCTTDNISFRMTFTAPPTTNVTPQFIYGNNHVLNICKGSAAISLDSILTAVDMDTAQTLTWSVVQAASHGTLVAADSVASGDTIVPSGLIYTPDVNFIGTDTFTVQISDTIATATATIIVSVHGVTPGFSINAAGQCFNDHSFTLTDTSATTSGTLNSNWDLGDGSSSALTTVSKTYVTAGTYNVKLVATSSLGCIDSVTHTVAVNPSPVAGFTINNNGQCVNGNNFGFTDTSLVSGGTLTRVWSFGNGDTASSSAPNQSYTSANEYDVKLISISNEGCTDTVTRTIEVFAKPSPGFTVNNASQCANANNFTFNDTSLVAGGNLTREWSFGNGNTASSVNPSTSYTNATSYNVKLVSITNHGCKDSTTHTVFVRPVPTVGFTVNDDSQCENNNSFSFTDTTSVASGSYTRSWKFSSTDITSSANPVRTFTGAGTKNIKLVAESDQGCRDSVTKTVTLDAKPAATATAQSATTFCAGGSVTMNANTGTGLTYQWLNNGTVIGLQTAASYATATAGNYKVVVTNSNSCRDTSTTVSVTVNTNPVATATAASATTFCAGGSVTINANTGTGLTYQWLNNGSVIGSQTAGSYAATANGNYKTVVTNSNSCRDTSTAVSVTVNTNPVATATASTATIFCAGGSVTINANTGTGLTYQWLNNGTVIGSQTAGSYAATASGNYKAVVTNSNSCRDTSAAVSVTVNDLPSAYAVTGGGAYCSSGTGVAIGVNNSQSGINYQLYNGTTPVGTAAAGTGAAISFGNQATAGTYTVKATNATTLCGPVTMTGSATVTINPLPATYTVTGGGSYCVGGTGVAIGLNNSETGVNYQLYKGTSAVGGVVPGSGSSIGFGSFTAAGNYTVKAVNATTSCGPVVMTGSADVVINPLPTAYTVTGGGAYCNGGTGVAIGVNQSETGVEYRLFNGTSAVGMAVAGTGSAISFGNQTAAGTYTVKATNSTTSCGPVTMGGNATVTINPIPDVTDPLDQTLCNSAATTAVTFSGAVSGTAFNWTNDHTSTGLAASGTGNLISFTAVNATVSPVTSTIVVTPVANGCTGSSQTFTITVNPTADVNTVTNQALCNGASTATVNFTGAVSGTSFSWTNNQTSIGLAASGTGDISSFTATNTTHNIITATIEVTPTANSCIGATETFTITVNPTPDVAAVSNQTLCNETQTNLVNFAGNVSNTTFNWTNDLTSIGLTANGSGNINAFNAENTTAVAVTANLVVTPTANNCTGASQSFSITVNPTPAVNTVSGQEWCNGATTDAVSFSSAVSGTTFNWINDQPSTGLAASGAGDIASFTATNISHSIVTSNITVTPVANGCTGSPETFAITVNPTPDAGAVTSQAICNTTPVNAIVFTGNVSNTIFNWTNDLASIGLAATGSGDITSFNATNATSAVVTANLVVTPTANNCTGASQSFSIVVNPTPEVNAVSNEILCNGALTTAVTFGSATTGTTFSWTNDLTTIGLTAAGTGNIASFNAINTTSAPVTSAIAVTPSANGCTGSPETYSITVNPTPDVAAPSNQTICDGAATAVISFSSAVSGTTYSWTNNLSSIGLSASGNGDIVSFTAINTGTAPVTATITVTPTANSCSGPAQTFTITVNPTVVLSSTPTPAAICNNTVFHYTPASLTAGTTFSWSRAAVSGITNIAANGIDDPNEQLENTTALPITVTYVYTLTANGCSNTQSVAVIVNPSPKLNSASSATICSGALFAYTPASATAVSSFAWTRAAVTGITPATGNGTGSISETLLNSTLAPIDVVYNYILTAFSCTNAQTVTVTIDPAPAAPSITLRSASLCANTQYVNFGAASAQPSGVNYTWSATNAEVFATGSDKQYAVINFPAAGTSVVILTANVPGFGCTSKDTFTVEVGTGISHTTTIRYFNKHFVCMENTVTSYQWGYDDALTLEPTVLTGEINQNYLNPQPDLTQKFYWVITEKDGCMQKTYYKTPTALNQVTADQASVKAYPNPANDMIQVEINGLHNGEASVELIDMLGKTYGTYTTTGGKAQIEVSGLTAGVYFLSCYHNGVKTGVKRFVKN